MKRKFLGCLLSLIPLFVSAQVTISVQLPPSGLIQKDQLWNLIVSNNNNATLDVKLSLVLKDLVSSQTVLSANSGVVFLARGIRVISSRDIQPIDYNFISGNFSGNYLPVGSYIACYQVSVNAGEYYKPIATECVQIKINPLSPPQLNTPANHSIIQTNTPQFTWIPPMPSAMFDNLNYDLNIVEVKDGQSSADAIQQNIPIHQKNVPLATFENYSSAYSTLQPGKIYAWQITANSSQNYSIRTEVWTFTIAEQPVQKDIGSTSSYVLLKNHNEATGVHYLSNDTLFVKYYSFDKEHETTVRFLNADKKVIQEKKQSIIYGDNFLIFKLSGIYRKGQIYSVEITDLENHIYSTAFIKK